jgi:DNA-binding NtrC family response regulator
MDDRRILVVKLTESFGDFWNQFARDVGVGILTKGSKDPISCPGTAVAIVLAAGGAEQDVPGWLQRHEIPAGAPLFVVGADPSRRTGIKLVSRGATDYFAFPEDLELLRNAVQASIERLTHAERRSAQAAQKAKAKAFNTIIGESPALKETLSRAECILARPDTSALIMGETGTGKELLVRALHEGGPRAARPFVAVNCSALPNNLVESEFFGHERGAFTDAHAAKPGLFEIADGGTLFLDELGTLPLEVQAKLLRVLEDGEVRRVGATKSHHVDVRVMAATNEKLDEALASGSFRQDYASGVTTSY